MNSSLRHIFWITSFERLIAAGVGSGKNAKSLLIPPAKDKGKKKKNKDKKAKDADKKDRKKDHA